MNATRFATGLLLLGAALPAPAQETTRSFPTVRAHEVHYVLDCEARVLPSQRAVGEWTGQHNFAQVYATRQRLMGEVARACNRDGVAQVNLVLELRPGPGPQVQPWLARVEPTAR